MSMPVKIRNKSCLTPLCPFKIEGEKSSVTRETAKNYDFDEIPDSLANERVQKFEVEVLRCGWKIGDKEIQKPKVFEVF